MTEELYNYSILNYWMPFSEVTIGLVSPLGVGVPSYSVPEDIPAGFIRVCVEITAGGVERPVNVTLSTSANTAVCKLLHYSSTANPSSV